MAGYSYKKENCFIYYSCAETHIEKIISGNHSAFA